MFAPRGESNWSTSFWAHYTDVGLKTSHRHLGQLALELLCSDDHTDSDRESRLEGISDLHVSQHGVCSGMKTLPPCVWTPR